MKIPSFLVFLFTTVALGDYAWLPKPESLILKTGWEFFKSDANFDFSGKKQELTTNSVPSSLNQNQFVIDSEYGLIEHWSGILRTSVISAKISPLNSVSSSLSGAGLLDTTLGLKWQARQEKPVLALETGLVFPGYSTKNLVANELALGDGVAGVLLRVHGGARVKKFTFSLSPGLLFRFGGFSNQVLLDAAISVSLRKIYFRFFQASYFSMTKDSNSNQSQENLELGSGGSFSRLAIQPDLVSLGLKSGVFLSPKFKIEASLAQTVWGQTAADGFRIGLMLITNFDFSKPDTRESVQEVPLSSE